MNEPCILFSGSANPQLAKAVADCSISSDIKLGEIYHHAFASGEHYCQIKENIRGADVFLMQSAFRNSPLNSNDALMQLLIMIDAARRASAGRITAVLPTFFYQRQDRKDKSRVPISSKLVMDLLAASGANRIVTMDLHAQQLQGFTNLPLDHLYFRPVLIQAMESKDINVVVAPDVGAIKKAEEFARHMGLDIAFISKKRKSDTVVETSQFVGDVKDKNVLIVDDLTESAGTLVAAAKECKKNGAETVICAVTHNCMTSLGVSRLKEAYENGDMNEFYCSDCTSADKAAKYPWFNVLSVADLFSITIHNIHNNISISSIFE